MIDYSEVSMVGVDVLQLVTDGQRRKALDNFLVLQAPLIEEAMRAQVEELIDEINAQLPDPFWYTKTRPTFLSWCRQTSTTLRSRLCQSLRFTSTRLALAGERPASEALLERIEQMRSSAEEMALMFNAEAARWAHREHKSAMLLEKLQATID